MTKVDLITGFLGEGKTTFLRGYGTWLAEQATSFAVLENEFGAAGVDAALLEHAGMEVRELSGGCICCALPVGFHDTLVELSKEFQRILVEPSGIFDPASFFDIMHSAEVAERCEHGMMLAIVDPATTPKLSVDDQTVLAAELQHSGQILLSKVEQVDDALRQRTAQELWELLEDYTALSVEEIYQRIYPKPLLALTGEDYATLQHFLPQYTANTVPFMDHTFLFQSTTLYPTKIYSNDEIIKAMEELIHAGTVVRAKGYLKGEDGGFFVDHTANGQQIVATPEVQEPMLNVIGRQLNRNQIDTIFP